MEKTKTYLVAKGEMIQKEETDTEAGVSEGYRESPRNQGIHRIKTGRSITCRKRNIYTLPARKPAETKGLIIKITVNKRDTKKQFNITKLNQIKKTSYNKQKPLQKKMQRLFCG